MSCPHCNEKNFTTSCIFCNSKLNSPIIECSHTDGSYCCDECQYNAMRAMRGYYEKGQASLEEDNSEIRKLMFDIDYGPEALKRQIEADKEQIERHSEIFKQYVSNFVKEKKKSLWQRIKDWFK